MVTSQGDDYATGCRLDYNWFNNYCKMIAIDLSKTQAPDVDPKAIQKINFTADLDQDATVLFIFEKTKTSFRFSTRNC